MDTMKDFFSQLAFKSDFVAVSYEEWQQSEAKQKPYRLIRRLRKLKKAKPKRTYS